MTAVAQWTLWWLLSSAAVFPSDTIKKSLTLFLLAGFLFTVLSSVNASWENNGSLISVIFSSIYIMKSSRSGCLLWCPLIFDTSLFHLSVRLPGSFETIIHSISGEFKVFHLWLAAALLQFSKKLWNFLNPLSLQTWYVAVFYFLSAGGQYPVWVAIHLF